MLQQDSASRSTLAFAGRRLLPTVPGKPTNGGHGVAGEAASRPAHSERSRVAAIATYALLATLPATLPATPHDTPDGR